MEKQKINSTLRLSRKDMRTLGYRIVDMIVEHVDTIQDRPVSRITDRATLERLLREPIPEQGTGFQKVLDQLRDDVLPHMMHTDHPRFFAFVSSPGNFVSAVADGLVSGLNPFAGTWMEASGLAQIELVTIDWLAGLCGLPGTAGGLFVSGGSMANITGLAVARHVKLQDRCRDAVVYMSDQTHASIARGLRVLGFTPSQLTILPSDDRYRLSIPGLERRIAEDHATGRTPFCVVANAGTTNTGAVDPLPELADLCRRENLWLHADGAYGAAAAVCDRGRALLPGLERVDSMSLDPHKWLFQPYEIGCILVRERHQMRATFHMLPEYLQDLETDLEEINFYDYGIQLTRRCRALKLWMSLKVFGLAAFRAAVEHGFELAEFAEQTLRERPGWEIVTPAQMGVVTFRYVPANVSDVDAFNRDLIAPMLDDGFALVMSTVIKAQTVLRFCTINPRTTEDDILQSIEKLDHYAQTMNG